MEEKIILDMLTQNSVSIKKQNYIIMNGIEYLIGEPWRKAYVNSINGREELKAELTEPYLSVVILMWGNNPTINEE
jgi:hypothetical protein